MDENKTRDEVPESKYLFAFIGGMVALVGVYMVVLVTALSA